MKIRKAEERDVPALLEIYNYEVLHGTATFDLNPRSLEERRAWFYAHPGGRYLLLTAEENGVPVGYASLSPYREKEAYAATAELSIYVAADCRGRGIGSALMQRILEHARACEELHTVVSVITGDNDGSIRMHQRYGFSDCGRIREVGRKFGKWMDIVNMQLIV